MLNLKIEKVNLFIALDLQLGHAFFIIRNINNNNHRGHREIGILKFKTDNIIFRQYEQDKQDIS
jgi:hypothetical protein